MNADAQLPTAIFARVPREQLEKDVAQTVSWEPKNAESEAK
jgi:hypothetical protein